MASELFPVHPPSLDGHHQTIHRHGRVLASHTNQIVSHNERIKELENQSPVSELRDLEKQLLEKINKIESDVRIEVTRMRTAIYVAAVLIGGTGLGSKVLEILQPPTPIVIQSAPVQPPDAT